MARPGPLDAVRRALEPSIPAAALEALPRAYFRVGDVLLLDPPVPEPAEQIAEAYARTLGMRSVLLRIGGIEGEFREPRMKRLWGDANTDTIHTENHVRYRLDPARVMWSPGNLSERQRAARWKCQGETVVDFFSGVGYFSLPVLVHAGAFKVVAIEKNPIAHGYLVANGDLNGIADRLDVRLGDCRDVAPRGSADRVLLGLLPDAIDFVSHAVATLRPQGGLLHVHRVVDSASAQTTGFAEVQEQVESAGRKARLVHLQRVKSYAARRDHFVYDVEVTA